MKLHGLALAALFTLLGAPLARAQAGAEPATLVRLDARQVQLARIAVAGVESLDAADAGRAAQNLQLQGMAVLPPQATQVLSAPLAGFVQSVHVQPGQTLQTGQLVAQIHSSELVGMQREWVQNETLLRQARERLAREERLFADGIVPELRVRDARHALVLAEVALAERQAALKLAGLSPAQLQRLAAEGQLRPLLAVHAGVAGQVIEVTALAGQRVEAGAPLARIARPGLLSVELQATLAQSARIRPGAKVQIEGCPAAGRVQSIAPLMRESNQSTTVLVSLPDAARCLLPNQALSAEVAAAAGSPGAPARLSVPAAALFRHGGADHVFVQEPGGYRAVPVQVAGRQGDRAILSRGPGAEAKVVVSGLAALKGAWLGLGEPAAAPAAAASGAR